MTITFVDPVGLPEVEFYRQVSVATGSKLVSIAGQVAVDARGALVGGGDLATQVEQCYRNVGEALAAAGASFDDVAKLTVYVVDWTPDKITQFREGVSRAASGPGTKPAAPATLIGVAALAASEYLVEIEATAVIN